MAIVIFNLLFLVFFIFSNVHGMDEDLSKDHDVILQTLGFKFGQYDWNQVKDVNVNKSAIDSMCNDNGYDGEHYDDAGNLVYVEIPVYTLSSMKYARVYHRDKYCKGLWLSYLNRGDRNMEVRIQRGELRHYKDNDVIKPCKLCCPPDKE